MKPDGLTFAGRKHTAESNKKRSDTIKKLYANGSPAFGFKTKYTTEEQKKEARKASRLKNRYGLTTEEFNLMLKLQHNTCAICINPAVVVDHDHVTGKVRGLLCSQCNAALGFLEDNIVYLKNAIEYLEEDK